VQEVLQEITLLQKRNKNIRKEKTKDMKKMLQNIINRYKIFNDTIKAQLGGKKKTTTKQKKFKKVKKNNNKKNKK